MGVEKGMTRPPVEVNLDDKEDDLYMMDEKSEGEGEGVDRVGVSLLRRVVEELGVRAGGVD